MVYYKDPKLNKLNYKVILVYLWSTATLTDGLADCLCGMECWTAIKLQTWAVAIQLPCAGVWPVSALFAGCGDHWVHSDPYCGEPLGGWPAGHPRRVQEAVWIHTLLQAGGWKCSLARYCPLAFVEESMMSLRVMITVPLDPVSYWLQQIIILCRVQPTQAKYAAFCTWNSTILA